jgi:hypothetical protein
MRLQIPIRSVQGLPHATEIGMIACSGNLALSRKRAQRRANYRATEREQRCSKQLLH